MFNYFKYELVFGKGSKDNHFFRIEGHTLFVNEMLIKEQLHYNIRVRTTDKGGLSFEKTT